MVRGTAMNIRVLVVDDEEDFLNSLTERLEARNLLVSTALNGDQALDCLNREEIDVVVLDMLMPGRSGIEILREMKILKPLVEVILLTGQGALESASEGMRLGAYFYLIKPVDIKKLMEMITGAYKRKSEHEERIRQADIERILVALQDSGTP